MQQETLLKEARPKQTDEPYKFTQTFVQLQLQLFFPFELKT